MTLVNSRLSRRIPELDGIRGLAILLIVVMHYFVEIAPTMYAVYFRLAVSGVDLFFVLSGFLIAGILLDARSSESYYKTFYMRRFHRIIPVYAVWLAIFMVGVYFVRPQSAVPLKIMFNAVLPLWTYFLFLQNFAIALIGDFGTAWMGITWSLAVEEQFYLLLPLIVRRLSAKALLRFTLAMMVLALVFRIWFQLLGTKSIVMYTLLPCRADALGCGVLLAIAYRNERLWHWFCSHRRYLYTAFLLLAFGVAVWSLRDFQLMTRIGYTWMAAFYTTLLLLVLANPGRLERRLFGNAVIVRLGTIAYAVYLFHSGILWLLHDWFFQKAPTMNSPATVSVTLLSLVTTLVLAELSWRFLEKPMIRRGRVRYHYGVGFTVEPKPAV